jgi:hypothetical protein
VLRRPGRPRADHQRLPRRPRPPRPARERPGSVGRGSTRARPRRPPRRPGGAAARPGARHRPRSDPLQRAVVPHPAAVRPVGAAPPPVHPPGAATGGAARRAVTVMVGPVSGAVSRAQPAGARLGGRPGARRHRCGPGTAARVAAPGAQPAGQAARATLLRHPPRRVSSEAGQPEATRPARARRPGRLGLSGCARCAGRNSGASWT